MDLMDVDILEKAMSSSCSMSEETVTANSTARTLSSGLSSSDVAMEDQEKEHCSPSIKIKWIGSGKEIWIGNIDNLETVGHLKQVIYLKTGVQVARQKLLNLAYKGKLAKDDCALYNTSLSLRPSQTLMMMGSLEEDIQSVDIPPEERQEVYNDLDVLPEGDDGGPLERRQVYLDKIKYRIKNCPIRTFNSAIMGKRLLVLGLDCTLINRTFSGRTVNDMLRPHVHDFLTTAYEDYNIAIWAAKPLYSIYELLSGLGITKNENYKIHYILGDMEMVPIHTLEHGYVEVKALAVLWGQISEYSAKNTIMIDSNPRNFLMNPGSGLAIQPFINTPENCQTDIELQRVGKYLKKIVKVDDFSLLDHSKWESYYEVGEDQDISIQAMEVGGGDSIIPVDILEDEDEESLSSEEIAAKRARHF